MFSFKTLASIVLAPCGGTVASDKAQRLHCHITSLFLHFCCACASSRRFTVPFRPYDGSNVVKLCSKLVLRQSRLDRSESAKVVCRSPGTMKSDFIIEEDQRIYCVER